MSNIYRASHEWATRPDDQRFLSLADLRAAVEKRKNESWTATPPVSDFRVLPDQEDSEHKGLIVDVFDPTAGERRALAPTNLAFGQLSQYASAPASYLRKLPPELAAINLQWGLEHNPLRDDTLLLAQSNGSHALRSLTSTSYGRIWDLDVVKAVEKANQSGRWQIPSASYAVKNPKRATTLYASDRDCFIFLVDEKNQIDVPTDGGRTREMHRGFFVWNSEVGAATFGLTTFLYDYICDNRIIWGASQVVEVTIRHTRGAPERFAYEGDKFLENYANESTQVLVEGIKTAQRTEVPVKKDQSIEQWLQGRGFTKAVAQASVEYAKAEEGQARSVWDIVNGITAYARSIPHTNDRVEIEAKAGKLMADVTE